MRFRRSPPSPSALREPRSTGSTSWDLYYQFCAGLRSCQRRMGSGWSRHGIIDCNTVDAVLTPAQRSGPQHPGRGRAEDGCSGRAAASCGSRFLESITCLENRKFQLQKSCGTFPRRQVKDGSQGQRRSREACSGMAGFKEVAEHGDGGQGETATMRGLVSLALDPAEDRGAWRCVGLGGSTAVRKEARAWSPGSRRLAACCDQVHYQQL